MPIPDCRLESRLKLLKGLFGFIFWQKLELGDSN